MTYQEQAQRILEGLLKVLPQNMRVDKIELLVISILHEKRRSFEMGYIAAHANSKDVRIGSLLENAGLVVPEGMELALSKQKP